MWTNFSKSGVVSSSFITELMPQSVSEACSGGHTSIREMSVSNLGCNDLPYG
jgi:hypothetical protein